MTLSYDPEVISHNPDGSYEPDVSYGSDELHDPDGQ